MMFIILGFQLVLGHWESQSSVAQSRIFQSQLKSIIIFEHTTVGYCVGYFLKFSSCFATSFETSWHLERMKNGFSHRREMLLKFLWLDCVSNIILITTESRKKKCSHN